MKNSLYGAYGEPLSNMLEQQGGVLTTPDALDANIPKKALYHIVQKIELVKIAQAMEVQL